MNIIINQLQKNFGPKVAVDIENYSIQSGNVITAVKILAEIGDIKRFANANKLAQFAGIAPLHLSSSGKGKDVATKQGNRRL